MNILKTIVLCCLAIGISNSSSQAFMGMGEPPISVNVRPSLVGAGYALIITNTSDEFLHEVTVEAKGTNGDELQRQVVAVTLKPHKSVDVGWLELGWQFEPGEKVYVGAKGYWSTIAGTVPK